ncbi:MAG: phosphomannomutase/phosphoglucomutase [Candidatus Doudnabacteria bacterium]|nr:phosphomannomutase/phosphoglucomutase [Candidatus Doudnabacteria bacterium]
MPKLNQYMFREYDIRGVAGRDAQSFDQKIVAEYERWYGPFPGVTLTLDAAEKIGQAYGTIIRRNNGKETVIGYELRPFAEELTNAFIAGVRKSGCNVTNLGVSLTPIVYFLTAFLKFDGGVNVTGSHNVYFFNGFKMMKKNVWPLFGEELQKMRRMIDENDLMTDQEGDYKEMDGYPVYREYFLSHVKLQKKLKVVLDTGNGSGGVFAPELLRDLGCDVIELFTEVDATFPNHIPDPEAPQYYSELLKQVAEHGADIGIALDADGDRVGFFSEKGKYIDTDLPLLVFAKDALSRHPGKKILFDVKCSRLLSELVPQYGGVPLMHRTGHAPIKETMRKDLDIILGGEVSGHVFFVEDYFKIDDGLYAAGKMLELLSKSEQPFSRMFADFPERIRTPEIKLPCSDDTKFKVVEQIQQTFIAQYPVLTIDGARVQFSEKGWGLIRASNTSPYLTIRVEGETIDEVLKIKNILADELEKFPEVADKLNRVEVASLSGKLGWV